MKAELILKAFVHLEMDSEEASWLTRYLEYPRTPNEDFEDGEMRTKISCVLKEQLSKNYEII